MRGRAKQPATHSLFLSGLLSSSGQHCLISQTTRTRASERIRTPRDECMDAVSYLTLLWCGGGRMFPEALMATRPT